MSDAAAATTPITILIGALGGEGGGVLAEWLVETATACGYFAQGTSIPGVAQRTGATTYYVEIVRQPMAVLRGRKPVLSLLPVQGCVDLAIASELLEAGRIVQNGMVSAERTLLVTSTSRTLTTLEKMALGDGRFDAERLLAVARTHSRILIAFDMEAVARDAGTVVSAVMFGAVAASGLLPFARESFEHVVRSSGRGAEASLLGFARAWHLVVASATETGGDVAMPNSHPAVGLKPDPQGNAAVGLKPDPQGKVAGDGVQSFPEQVRDILALGYERLLAFQDRDYAELYLQRLGSVLGAERHADPSATHGLAMTRETARFLALWMAFDDIVRVAHLKCRASRFARVRREVAADDGDVVHIVDYFKPGVPEVAGLLPPWLARRLMRWDESRQRNGRAPMAVALHVRADTIIGFLGLRILSSLKGLRRRGSRYAQEQVLIERWLLAVAHSARIAWDVANEIALCGRLIKGYGTTNERGKRNLEYILIHLVDGGAFATGAARAAAIRGAREAALADDAGRAFDQTLVAHGAPARPIVAQPIRWARKPPTITAAGPAA